MGKTLVCASARARDSLECTSEPMDACDDDTLLQRIGEQRDREAFDELFRRYHPSAFNLALHMTQKRTLAEEAVQEAMLRIWVSASTYRPGKARSWILRIVANESLKALQGAKKGRESMNRSNPGEPRFCQTTPGEDAEHREILAALRRSLEHLPDLHRQLLALHFGAGLTQQETGETLSLPPRTVSFKIEQALQSLRASLSQAGMLAAAPFLNSDGLGEALCSGYEAPLGLREKVMEKIASAGRGSLRTAASHSHRTAAAKAGSLAWLAASIAATALAAGAVWWLARSKPAAPQLVAAQPGPSAQRLEHKIHARWTFEKGPAEDLKVDQGEWHWVAAQAGRRAGMAVAQKTYVALPLPIPEGRCLEVTFLGVFTPISGVEASLSATWKLKDRLQNFSVWGKAFPVGTGIRNCSRTYLTEEAEIGTFWALPSQFLGALAIVYEDRVRREPYVFADLHNFLVQEIEVREISREEIPERFRDPKRLIAELELGLIRRNNAGTPLDAGPGKQKTE